VIVVTGASGFIGSALVGQLIAAGTTVVGIDRRPAPPHDDRRRHLLADLADPLAPRARDLLAAADVVVHLAGRPGVRDRSPGIELSRHRDNVLATRRVLEASGAPVVVASSSSVYGGSPYGRASHEDDVLRPCGGYAHSKRAAEAICAAHRDAGRAVCAVRPFTVIGPGQRSDMAIGRWLRAARAGGRIDVLGSLDRTRDVTDVADVVRALGQLAAMAAGGDHLPAVLNLGTGRPRSLGELVDAVARAVRRPVTVRVIALEGDEPDHTRADTARLTATLGWTPETDVGRVVAAQASISFSDTTSLTYRPPRRSPGTTRRGPASPSAVPSSVIATSTFLASKPGSDSRAQSSLAIITSVDLMITSTSSSTFTSRSSTEAFVIAAVICWPSGSVTWTVDITSPRLTAATFALSWFRALSFMGEDSTVRPRSISG
jgi:nucleoside-diphosphate-sugar epimerase